MLQALHGIKPSRVTSKVAVSQLLKTRKQKQSKHPNHHASDTNPPSQDWRPSRKRTTNRAIDESAGRQASPNKKPNKQSIKTIQLYKIKILAKDQDQREKNNAPGGRKLAEIGRSGQQTSSYVGETGEKRVPAGQAATNLQPSVEKLITVNPLTLPSSHHHAIDGPEWQFQRKNAPH